MKHGMFAVAFAASVLAATPVSAQFEKPETAIKYRQSAMILMSNHFGRVAAMAQGKIPFDPKVAADNAALAATLSRLPWAGFIAGSDKGSPTRARPEIWTDSSKFKSVADSLQSDMAKLDAAARGGNLDQIKGAAGAVGKSCKSCHDDFRAEKYSAS